MLKLSLLYRNGGLVEEVKVAKARNLVTLEESSDKCIRVAGIQVERGNKANTPGEW